MMNWSLILLGLVALSSVAIAENSYLIIVPNLLKVSHENQLSIFIAASASQPVEVKYQLTIGQQRIDGTITCQPGETRNATIALPKEFPVGAGELLISGTGGVRFEEKRDVIVYDNRHIILVQTSASTYRPSESIEFRVIATNEQLIPMENAECLVEIYDATLKIVGQFPRIAIRSGLTETFRFPIAEHNNAGKWLVSATIGNTTSSLEILVARPITPSFDLKAIFQRFILRTEKTLRGVIEIDCDKNVPIFGRGIISIGQITEQDVQKMMKEQKPQPEQQGKEEWRSWKSQEIEIAGRIELNYDLMSMFNIDVSKALAIQVYIQVTDLASGQERLVKHVIPVFTHDVIYDIRPLEFEAGIENEFEVIAKRPDGKPAKMEEMIVTVTMMLGNEQGKVQEEKAVEIKDFYTRGRNDIGLFRVQIPEQCIGVLVTITPMSEDGQVRGYRTHAVPLMPTPRRGPKGAKLSIELMPSTNTPTNTEVNAPVVSSQISTVGRTSNFYVQLMPSKSIEKFEPLPMSFVVMSNGRIVRTGEFTIRPTKECQSKTQRNIRPEEQTPPACVFNGTLPIQVTRDMVPYSTLLVYTFQPTFGFNVAESYRFSAAGLFQNTFALNATIVPFTSTSTTPEEMINEQYYESSHNTDRESIQISPKAQDKTRVQLSFTGAPGATVGLNVIEYDGVIQGLSNEITKERVLQYLTTYEQVPITAMPTMASGSDEQTIVRNRALKDRNDMYENEMSSGMDRSESKVEDGRRKETTPRPNMKSSMMLRGDESLSNDALPQIPRGIISEEQEESNIRREQTGYKIRYPIEKMAFGISSSRGMRPMQGDDVYTTSSMGRFYGEEQSRRSTPASQYRRKSIKSLNQYDVTVGDNDYVIAASMPLIFTNAAQREQERPMGAQEKEIDQQRQSEKSPAGEGLKYGSPAWYEKMNSKLSSVSQEAFAFLQSGLSVISDFQSLRIPTEMRRTNLTKLFSQYRQQASRLDTEPFNYREEARQLLEEYVVQSDASMVPPMILLEEQARIGYYQSIFFNQSRIESSGTGKVVLPRTKPYSTWLATGFALDAKTGLSVAQPIRLPTNQGLFVLANFPQQVQIGERVLLTYGINNYLGKDASNVVLRIRASADFDLFEQTQPERAAVTNGKDYTLTIPMLKSFAAETRHIVLVPKRAGVVKIVIEVECEFGGDYEVLTTYVRESGIQRYQTAGRRFNLTSQKKSYGPIVERINASSALRSVRVSVSATGLDLLTEEYSMRTNSLIGVDRAINRLWRALGLRRYLNETFQTESPLFNATARNISTAYQKLQLYADYNGSYSFLSEEGTQKPSLYLTTLAFGAMLSPFMPVRDNVTINRTLSWILAHQQQDGSFDAQESCFHYRFCAGEFRRESLTALLVYTWTRDNVSVHVPEFVRRRLYEGEQSPVMRAQRFLESRLNAIKSDMLTTSLVELALLQCPTLSEQMRQKIEQNLRSRQLTVMSEDGSKYLKFDQDKITDDDELLINALTMSLYAHLGDYKTTSEIAPWIYQQVRTMSHFDTLLDGVFTTEAWIRMELLIRPNSESKPLSITVDVTADNGQKQQFKIDQANMDITQHFYFTMPVNQITYSINGYGSAFVCIRSSFIDKQQQQAAEPMPFQITNEWTPMPWLSEIRTKTCLTYKPTSKDQQIVSQEFNRTVVLEVQIPSGMRLNLRQIGFALSRVANAADFSFDVRENKLNFVFNVPTNFYGKPICFEWVMERLSSVASWAPVHIRAYDYLRQDCEFVTLVPIQLQPTLLGYSFVDAIHKARPTFEQLANMHKQPIRN